MKEAVYIFIGGGIGSVLRYLAQMVVNERAATLLSFPFAWGTLMVNILGSLLIGLLYTLSERFLFSMEMKLFLTAGLCGGFTTFSTFSNDALNLLKGGHYTIFLLYALLSITLGVAAVIVGGWIGKQIG